MNISRIWRLKAQHYRMEGSVCLGCGQGIFPPRPFCSGCSSPSAACRSVQAAEWPFSASALGAIAKKYQQIDGKANR
jgi:hypothetical protein